MEFKIGEKLIKNKYLDCYVVEIKTMYGDADGYGKVKIGGFKKDSEEHFLIDLLETCERMKMAYPNGRGGFDDYNDVEGFERWFDIDNLDEDIWESLSEREKELHAEWSMNPCGDGTQASYYGFKVFYYDESGFKYSVTVK